jgi:photosystem II stability/assembly factor-like uncharacterized protein
LWKTTDRGASWTPLGDKLPSLNVRAVAVDPDNPEVIYLASHNGKGYFKSNDGGENWFQSAPGGIAGETQKFVPGELLFRP